MTAWVGGVKERRGGEIGGGPYLKRENARVTFSVAYKMGRGGKEQKSKKKMNATKEKREPHKLKRMKEGFTRGNLIMVTEAYGADKKS